MSMGKAVQIRNAMAALSLLPNANTDRSLRLSIYAAAALINT